MQSLVAAFVVDYPAAHSMDSEWFAIDDAGEVACLDSGESGPTVLGVLSDCRFFEVFEFLEKDAQGIKVFPSPDGFADGNSLAVLRSQLAALSQDEYAAIERLANEPDLPEEERKALRGSIRNRHVRALMRLSAPEDVLEFRGDWLREYEMVLVRLDSSRPDYYFCGADVSALGALHTGHLLAWRELDDGRDYWSGARLSLTDAYGIYHFAATGFDRFLRESLCPPYAPLKYERVSTPRRPRRGLPERIMTAKWTRRIIDCEVSFPCVHYLPGIRFSEMESIQLADFVPCYDWNQGAQTPDSAESIVRRNMAVVHAPRSPAREARIAEWRAAAEQGDIVSQYCLGYARLQDQPPQYEAAFRWFQMAAEQAEATPIDSPDIFANGSAAQCHLADLYERGVGVVKNDEQAQHWCAQSADKGNFFAQRRLGLIYLRNQGGALAAKWLAKTPLDHIDAYTLPYFAAAEGGASKAQYKTGQFYERRIGDNVRALHWYRLAAIQDHGEACLSLAAMYRHGKGTRRDFAQARSWLEKAAALGIESAQKTVSEQ